ncbi:Protein STB5 [Beauveria bassiana D1-5]|uniref:Protein STB5 n=1 Tax=Beauveria bassiana D1-5 TaxID=1245745 RepID=A0A0A2VNP3_BEABA|nr:Protein STB5 [Beauveria bassiana D1-5]
MSDPRPPDVALIARNPNDFQLRGDTGLNHPSEAMAEEGHFRTEAKAMGNPHDYQLGDASLSHQSEAMVEDDMGRTTQVNTTIDPNDCQLGDASLNHQPEAMVQDDFRTNANVNSVAVDPCPQQYQQTSHAKAPQAPANFVEELRNLSLEATAERHLGSTSGLSFAKLTQSVLRRLTPDKADFVFINYQENTANALLFDLDSPSDVFGESVLQGLSESVSAHPVLFGDLFLADFTESDSSALSAVALPSDQRHVRRLVNFYFAHSHTLYPILRRSDVMRTLDKISGNPHKLDDQPPLEVFRLWMVLAIGSTAYSSISLTEESESRLYFSKALQYSELSLGADDMVFWTKSALEVIILQVSYSFFNQLGPNTWFLVGTAARLALGMGLHTKSTYVKLSTEAAERCKRVFFSIYMMDRFELPSVGAISVVSVALGRPFAIHDNDIDVEDFSALDDDDCANGTPRDVGQPSTLVAPLHILALRRIASKISREIYSVGKTGAYMTEEQREETLSRLHQELLEWRRTLPFPLPDFEDKVPHLTTTWYDFNYYTHLAMIYRPSPLCPVPTVKRIKILENAACMSIRQAHSMHQQGRLAYNWLNFLALFTSTISLVYAVTAQPKDLPTVLSETRVIEDLDLVLNLFGTLGIKFLAATKIRDMIQEISTRYKTILAEHSQYRGSGLV